MPALTHQIKRHTPKTLDAASREKLEVFKDIIYNVVTSRSELVRSMTDPRRDIYDECGYPKSVSIWDLQELYTRFGIATRVVEGLPKECWKETPEVYDDPDEGVVTVFEEAWRDLPSMLNQRDPLTQSSLKSQEGSTIWECLARADRLSGIGRYGIILIGLNDGQELDQPAKPRQGQELTFLRCFPEAYAEISMTEPDETSPRYGEPVLYNISLDWGNSSQAIGSVGQSVATGMTKQVHWSRVIHIPDNVNSSEIYGNPRMMPVLNHLLDLFKLYGATAEMYWRGAMPVYTLEVDPSLVGDTDTADDDEIKDELEEWWNGFQRVLLTDGMRMRSHAPQVIDPSPQIERTIEAICIHLEWPKRIFMGSERGGGLPHLKTVIPGMTGLTHDVIDTSPHGSSHHSLTV